MQALTKKSWVALASAKVGFRTRNIGTSEGDDEYDADNIIMTTRLSQQEAVTMLNGKHSNNRAQNRRGRINRIRVQVHNYVWKFQHSLQLLH